MNKKLLIISPYFPPVNAADMQRVRMSLPYFEEFGWEAEIVTIDPLYADLPLDDLLLETVPAKIKVHKVAAFNKKWTAKLGLGSIALRSLWFYRKTVNELLKNQKFDLIYFSTTQFPVCILGAYWKKRFGVPYVIDMQDPWHSDYYKDKPRQQQPKKYWLSYRLNKYLEPIAMKEADGLISVSEHYITDLQLRYPALKNKPTATITFGSFMHDLDIAVKNESKYPDLLEPGFKNIVYIGRGGMDMYSAITPVFKALKAGLIEHPELFSQLKFYFIGTSYAPAGEGTPTIMNLAKQHGVTDNVIEVTDRISYYHTLVTLKQADTLFIPGSDDPKYTASKIYPYLLTGKPLLAIFNSKSSVVNILEEYGVKHNYTYNATPDIELHILNFLKLVVNNDITADVYNTDAAVKHSAQSKARQQCEIFNQVILADN
ncbi:glycosyltransferase [Mucilaginibacter sp.]|uniref:glycosyltransferase n=1 Tax=Mucilaginibacter sp. TaxID=1882438 RepID=UPI003569B939